MAYLLSNSDVSPEGIGIEKVTSLFASWMFNIDVEWEQSQQSEITEYKTIHLAYVSIFVIAANEGFVAKCME